MILDLPSIYEKLAAAIPPIPSEDSPCHSPKPQNTCDRCRRLEAAHIALASLQYHVTGQAQSPPLRSIKFANGDESAVVERLARLMAEQTFRTYERECGDPWKRKIYERYVKAARNRAKKTIKLLKQLILEGGVCLQ